MKLVYIKSPLETKSHNTIRSLLKKEQGEKITPYVLKVNKLPAIVNYLKQEKIKYEIYCDQEEADPNDNSKEHFIVKNDNILERYQKTKRWELAAISDWTNLLKR